MSISRSKYNSGFSLLEVLIAITILSFITIAIIAFTDGSIEKSLKVSSEDSEYLQIETAMSRVEWDVSQAYSPLSFDIPMNPQNLTETEGQIYNQLADYYQGNANFSMVTYDGLPIPLIQKPDKSTFIFFTTSNRRKVKNAKQSHFAWIKYELQDNETTLSDEIGAKISPNFINPAPADSKIFVRKMLTNNVYTKKEIEWDDIKSQVLMRKVISLVFEFWNPKTKKWVDNLDTIESGTSLLQALRLTMKYYDADNIEVTTVRIFRTLFPKFKPEDKYKYLKPETSTAGGLGGESETTTNGSNGTEGDNE